MSTEHESGAEPAESNRRGASLAVKFTLFLIAALIHAAIFTLWGLGRGHGGEPGFLLLAGVAILLPATAYVWAVLTVIRPIRIAAGHMALLAGGDAATDVAAAQLARGDEIGRLARAAQQLIDYRRGEVGAANNMAAGDFTGSVRLRGDGDILGQAIIRMAAATYAGLDRIAGCAERVLAGCQDVTGRAGEIAADREIAVGAVAELVAGANALEAGTGENAGKAREIGVLAAAGGRAVERGYDEVGEMGEVMLAMQSCGGKIVGIAKAIGDIAFQTNLLALNASVEAARAGHNGKGFTIVAQEVRRLSERTRQAANETSMMMQETVRQVELAAGVVGRINATFSDLNGHIDEINARGTEIAAAAGRQARDGEKISGLIRDLEAMIGQERDRAGTLAGRAGELTGQAEELRRAVGRFRHRGGGSRGLPETERRAAMLQLRLKQLQ